MIAVNAPGVLCPLTLYPWSVMVIYPSTFSSSEQPLGRLVMLAVPAVPNVIAPTASGMIKCFNALCPDLHDNLLWV